MQNKHKLILNNRRIKEFQEETICSSISTGHAPNSQTKSAAAVTTLNVNIITDRLTAISHHRLKGLQPVCNVSQGPCSVVVNTIWSFFVESQRAFGSVSHLYE